MAKRVMLARHFILAGAVAASLAGSVPVRAQVGPVICQCGDQRDFGSCVVTQQPAGLTYPGEFPGSATVAQTTIQNDDVTYLYIADLFNGFTYRYDGEVNQGILTPGMPFEVLVSPEGSNATTGLQFHPVEGVLYWAIDDRLIRTDLDLKNPEVAGTVDLDGLKTRLSLPVRGSLGGITYHEVRQAFWGVDIVNDVYFEFNEEGRLTIEDGQPVHFMSPGLNPFGGGAYGNSISYVNAGGISYFDVPTGSLIDGGVSRVVRVHASEGGEGDRTFGIGDPSGLFYELGPSVGPHGFITGVFYWSSNCGAANHTELLLSIPQPESGAAPRIFQVSVDDPGAATLAQFNATAAGSIVTLDWKALRPYGRLELKRRLLPAGNLVDVTAFTAFNSDPREYTDRNIADGLYEYIARVTPPAPSARRFPDVKERVAVGRGSIEAHASFRLSARPADDDPFAVTFIGSKSQILVADRITGQAHLYGTNLAPAGSLAGPFISEGLEGGFTTGVAWDSDTDSLLWILEFSGRSFLQKTALSGSKVGSRFDIDVPQNLRRTPIIADLSYDALKKAFWGVDRVNMLVYSFNSVGGLTGTSNTLQLPVPRAPDGQFGGGITVVESSGSQLVLDYTVGKASTGLPGELARVSYNRTGLGGDTLSVPGTESMTLDLRSILQSAEIGGAVTVVDDGRSFEYVVGSDTRRIYKLRMDAGIQGKEFRRGEVNNDGGAPNISDAIYVLNFLFKAGTALPCEDAADLNDDEGINISDAVFLFSYLFQSGASPAPPFASCGRDFDPPLSCLNATCS